MGFDKPVRVTKYNPVTKETTEFITEELETYCETQHLRYSVIKAELRRCTREKIPVVISISYDLTYMFEFV